ncbi:MAG: helix-turn-helix domain-containing protein [Methermicoccaceae archaeon]
MKREQGIATRVNGWGSDIRMQLAERMAGEITLSETPGEIMRKWRVSFGIAQTDLSTHLGVSPSVVSDYESGRRKSPGVQTVRRIVNAIIDMDIANGGSKVRAYTAMMHGFNPNVIYDMEEYEVPMSLDELAERIEATIVHNTRTKRPLYGHTIIDSLRAIIELSSNEFQRLYGWSTERALIFTKVSTGRSPMVALRVTSFKPGVVVLHGIEKVDEMALKIAEIEQIPVLTTMMDIEEMIGVLHRK